MNGTDLNKCQQTPACSKYYIPKSWNLGCIAVSTFMSLVMYALAPDTYSYPVIVAAFVLFIATAVNFYVYKNNKNYFTFDFIFTVTFAFVYFMYPVFVYPVYKYRYFMFALGFNENVITKATLLALVGYNFFVLGLLSKKQKRNARIEVKQDRYIDNKTPTILVFVYSIYHVLLSAGANSIYSIGGDTNPLINSGASAYLGILMNGIIVCSIAIEFHNLILIGRVKNWWQHNMLLWIGLGIEIIAILVSGSRTFALQYMLMIMAGYAIIHNGMSLKKIVVIMLCGFCFMSFILIARSNGLFKYSFNILDMGMDLIITNYTLYTGYDYVQSSGLLLFPLLGSLLSIVPLLQGFTVNMLGIPMWETSSARFFSYLAMGENPTFGVGTNIIASVYLSTGLIGVIILMFLLGYFISAISTRVECGTLYKKILFFCMIGFSIYLVRSEYFYVASKITYALLFGFVFYGKWGRLIIKRTR